MDWWNDRKWIYSKYSKHLHGFITRLSAILHSNFHHRQLYHTRGHCWKTQTVVTACRHTWGKHRKTLSVAHSRLRTPHTAIRGGRRYCCTYTVASPLHPGPFRWHHPAQRDWRTPALPQGICWLHWSTRQQENMHMLLLLFLSFDCW